MRIYSHASSLSMTSNSLRRSWRLKMCWKAHICRNGSCALCSWNGVQQLIWNIVGERQNTEKGARKSRIAHLPFTREFAIFPASRNCHPIDFYNNVVRWICFCFLHSTRWLQPIFSFANLWHTFRPLSTITQFCIMVSTFEWFSLSS